MRIRENLGSLVAASSRTTPSPITKPQIGKVYGVITTENTPTKDLFDKSGGWGGIGTIFYLDYDQAKDIDTTDLTKCKIAKPFHASNQNYPLIGELVHLIDSPAPTSQTNNTSTQKYYTGTINIWNNNQQNSPSAGDLGKTFSEKSDTGATGHDDLDMTLVYRLEDLGIAAVGAEFVVFAHDERLDRLGGTDLGAEPAEAAA